MPKEIYQVGNEYTKALHYNEAELLYQYVIANWPDSEYEMWAMTGIIKLDIWLGNDANVQPALDELIADFNDQPALPEAIFVIGEQYYYKAFEDPNKCRTVKSAEHLYTAKDIWEKVIAQCPESSSIGLKHAQYFTAVCYRRLGEYEKAIKLYQYVVDNRPDADYAAWSQMDLAKSYVAIGDEDAAATAVNKLLANFSNNPSIVQIVYDMASCYREAKKHPKAISLYKHIIDNWPQQKYAMWSVRDLAMSNFDLGDDPNAKAAVDKLIANYSDNGHIQWNVYEIAKYYRKHAKYKKAIELYQRVVDNWPGTDHALWSQLDMAMSYATIGEDPNAEAAIDKLVTGFSENQHIAGVVYEMAKSYRLSRKDENANHICNLIIGKWPKSEHALWAQRDLARFSIAVGDDLNAQAAVDKLLADFSRQGRIAQAVYDIAKQYHDLQKYEKAVLFYQYVIDNWPDEEYAMRALSDLAKLHIELGDDAAAQKALDTLIADFNDHPDVPTLFWILAKRYEKLRKYPEARTMYHNIVTNYPGTNYAFGAQRNLVILYFLMKRNGEAQEALDKLVADFSGHIALPRAMSRIGKEYFNQAFWEENEGRHEKAKDYFRKAIIVFERIIQGLPPSPTYTPDAYYFSAVCHESVGEYEKAMEYYQKIIDNWPGYEHASQAKFLINAIVPGS